MGSPLSRIIADLVLQDLKKKALNTLASYILFYVHYVDDIDMGAPSKKKKNEILQVFNSFHLRL